MITFDDAIAENQEFILSCIHNTEITGYFTECRVDRNTVPEGWHVYDLRQSDGVLVSIENSVCTNHGGTFLTRQIIHMNAAGYRKLGQKEGCIFARKKNLRDFEDLNDLEMTYLHGYCHMWAYAHFRTGDTLRILAGSNDQSGSRDLYLIHCYLERDGKYIDVRGETDDEEILLEEFADEIPDDRSYTRYFVIDNSRKYCKVINRILRVKELPPHDIPEEVMFDLPKTAIL